MTEQIEAKNEIKLYEEARPALLTILDLYNVSHESLYLQNGKTFSSLWLRSVMLCRIGVRGKQCYISIAANYKEAIKQARTYGLKEITQKSDADTSFVRFSFSGTNPDILHELFRLELMNALDNAPKEYSCCARYVECSDAKKCIHPDKDMAFGCYYKKNLMNGRIFYGDNPTE